MWYRKLSLVLSFLFMLTCYTNCAPEGFGSGGAGSQQLASSGSSGTSNNPPGGSGSSPTPTPGASLTPTPSPTATPPMGGTPTPTPSSTATPAPTATPMPTVTPTPTPTPTPAPTMTPTPTPSNPSNPNGKWVLTGYGGRHMASIDGGKTWTNDVSDVANGGDDKWLQRAAAFFKGAFITIGWRIQRSTDGVQFKSSEFLKQWFGGVAEGKGRLVAVGGCGGRTYSDDGLNWTEIPDPACSSHLRSVVYGNGIFFAYGDNGARMTSTDGVTWTKLSNYAVTGVAFGLGYFWGVGTNKVVRSVDGVTWTDVTIAGATGFSGFYFVNNFVLLTTSTKNYRTLDGTTWSAFGSGMSGIVSYGGGVYIALTWQTVYRSTDGMNWTQTSKGGNSFDAMAWAP